MTKHFCILFLLMVGLILGPTQSFAQNNKAEMACCKKESSDSEKQCCKEKKDKKNNHNCDSGCLGVSCACPVVSCGFNLMVALQEDNLSLFDFVNNEQNFFYSEIFISSDLCSIWLPPRNS